MTTFPTFDRRAGLAVGLDLVMIVVFAVVGRSTHEKGLDVGGVLLTLGPFLVGLVVGWALVVRLGRTWPVAVGHGITVWAATLVLGMLLRAVSGQGTALSFVVVATLFLGVTLVGWRVAVQVLDRGKSVEG